MAGSCNNEPNNILTFQHLKLFAFIRNRSQKYILMVKFAKNSYIYNINYKRSFRIQKLWQVLLAVKVCMSLQENTPLVVDCRKYMYVDPFWYHTKMESYSRNQNGREWSWLKSNLLKYQLGQIRGDEFLKGVNYAGHITKPSSLTHTITQIRMNINYS